MRLLIPIPEGDGWAASWRHGPSATRRTEAGAFYDLRERLDPYIRDSSPLSVPIRKPKATWVEPVL